MLTFARPARMYARSERRTDSISEKNQVHRLTTTPFVLLLTFVLLMAVVAACGEDEPEPAGSSVVTVTEPDPTSTPQPAMNDAATPAVQEPTPVPSGQSVTPVPATGEPAPTTVPASVEPTEAAEDVDDQVADEPLPEPENPAPELLTTAAWYNTDPLVLRELRGGPVLLVFWNTY
jgi:hypothetical protein